MPANSKPLQRIQTNKVERSEDPWIVVGKTVLLLTNQKHSFTYSQFYMGLDFHHEVMMYFMHQDLIAHPYHLLKRG